MVGSGDSSSFSSGLTAAQVSVRATMGCNGSGRSSPGRSSSRVYLASSARRSAVQIGERRATHSKTVRSPVAHPLCAACVAPRPAPACSPRWPRAARDSEFSRAGQRKDVRAAFPARSADASGSVHTQTRAARARECWASRQHSETEEGLATNHGCKFLCVFGRESGLQVEKRAGRRQE